jgi:hypothetical protein
MIQDQKKDFYISYTRADRSWAKWIAWQLQEAGYTTVMVSDFKPGSSFVAGMNDGLIQANRVIAVLSPNYLKALYTQAEWQTAFAQDPTGEQGKLVPVRVEECLPQGLLMIIGYIDLVGSDEQQACERLLSGVNRIAHRAPTNPPFPSPLNHISPSFQVATKPSPLNHISPSFQVATKLRQQLTAQITLKQIETKQIERNATADKPIQKLQEDKLNFAAYVLALRDFIRSPDTSTPLTISIDGPWGIGKTSLMRMLQNELDSSSNVWSRLQTMKTWLKWFIGFFATLPIWIIGKIFSRNNARVSNPKRSRFDDVLIGLSYNPDNLDIDLESLPKHVRFWAKIAAHHNFMMPQTHPTVWFNAWKFDQEEQLWAALALTVMDQIKQRYSVIGRVIFWLRLMLRRFSLDALWNLIVTLTLPLCFGLIAWLYTAYQKQLPTLSLEIFKLHLSLGQLLIWMGFIVSSFIQVLKIAKDPFQLQIKNVLDKPNYKDKVGFIGSFETDFSRIVSLATQPYFGWKRQKLIIFIDDLDRCQAPKAVDIIEAINLFLDSESCVFILGMDSGAVVTSIETKYKDLFEKMKQENASVISHELCRHLRITFSLYTSGQAKCICLAHSLSRQCPGSHEDTEGNAGNMGVHDRSDRIRAFLMNRVPGGPPCHRDRSIPRAPLSAGGDPSSHASTPSAQARGEVPQTPATRQDASGVDQCSVLLSEGNGVAFLLPARYATPELAVLTPQCGVLMQQGAALQPPGHVRVAVQGNNAPDRRRRSHSDSALGRKLAGRPCEWHAGWFCHSLRTAGLLPGY